MFKLEIAKENVCNGCSDLLFAECACKKNLNPRTDEGKKSLNSYKDGDGYITVFKPSDCMVGRTQKGDKQ